MVGKESRQSDLAAFWEDPAQAVQGLQGRSPLLSAGDAVQGIATSAMVRSERSDGGGGNW